MNAKVEEAEEMMQGKVAEETNTDDDLIIKIEGDDHSDGECLCATKKKRYTFCRVRGNGG